MHACNTLLRKIFAYSVKNEFTFEYLESNVLHGSRVQTQHFIKQKTTDGKLARCDPGAASAAGAGAGAAGAPGPAGSGGTNERRGSSGRRQERFVG